MEKLLAKTLASHREIHSNNNINTKLPDTGISNNLNIFALISFLSAAYLLKKND